MTKQQYLEICSYLAGVIAGTEWEDHVFVVGGAVRSYVMGDDIKDIDVVIDLPEGGIRFGRWIKAQGYTSHSVVEYERFGVTMFHLDAFPAEEIECVFTRCEKYPDRTTRNPVTEFGTLQEDCFRRDLTINALYYNVSQHEVLDLTGRGLDDIRDHIIRVTANPDIIFDDDPLRILRAIRFSARYGWEIETGTLQGMKRNVHRLPMLSQERVTDELRKILVCDRPAYAMHLLKKIGAVQYVLPELTETFDMMQNKYHDSTVWEHTLRVLDGVKCKELEVRLAALLHDIGKVVTRTVNESGDVHFIGHEEQSAVMAEKILRRMKIPTAQIREVCFLARNHMRLKNYNDALSDMKPKRLRRLMYDCRCKERFLRLVALIDADNNAHAEGFCLPNQIPALLQLATAEERMFGFRLPINGKDVMENCKIFNPSDIRIYLNHALTLAFAFPEWDRARMIQELQHYKIARQ